MARLITTGFETNSFPAEGLSSSGGTIVSTTPRSGAFCGQMVSASAVAVTISSLAGSITGGATGRDYFLRTGVRISANPANAVQIIAIVGVGGGSTQIRVRLNTDGTLDLLDTASTKIGSSSAALTAGVWYRVEVRCQVNTSTTGVCEMRVDGTTVTGTNVTNANLGTAAPDSLTFGWATSTQSTATILIDDVALNDSVAGTGGTTWPGEGKQVLLVPTADSAVGTGWTNSSSTNTGLSLFEGVNNEPPKGVADTTADTYPDSHQVRNATSNANSAYTATMTTYTAAGVGASDTLTLIQWLVATGAPSATSPKAGSARVLTNPVDGGLVSFGNFYQGTSTAGTYSTGWKVARGNVTDSSLPASGSYGTAPTMSLNQVTSSTRIALCCFMGVYVEYVPGVAHSMHGPNRRLRDALLRR